MRILIGALLLFFAAVAISAQQTPVAKCELQQMAIDAALGDTGAQYNLAVEFYRGKRVPQDYKKAATLWQLASEAGEPHASNNLGFLKYYGRPGVERDYETGVRLFRLAAERGHAESQVHLAEAYSDSKFLPPDFVEAYAWAKAAMVNAPKMEGLDNDATVNDAVFKMGMKLVNEMRRKLTTAQVNEAEQRAADYVKKYQRR